MLIEHFLQEYENLNQYLYHLSIQYHYSTNNGVGTARIFPSIVSRYDPSHISPFLFFCLRRLCKIFLACVSFTGKNKHHISNSHICFHLSSFSFPSEHFLLLWVKIHAIKPRSYSLISYPIFANISKASLVTFYSSVITSFLLKYFLYVTHTLKGCVAYYINFKLYK